MGVTAAHIEAALRSVGAIGGQAWSFSTIAAGADEACRQAGINTRQGAACLVAQCMVESAYFRTTREYGGASARYAPYYGRGFIQVTWADNYRAFGRWCHARGLVPSGDWFMAPNQDRLADPKWAWLGAVWYFTTHRHGLVALANAGDNIKVGRAINRGNAHSAYAAYGEDHRQQAYRALLNAGITAPTGAPSTGGSTAVVLPGVKYSVKQVQELVGVKADGEAGPATVAAIKEAQSALGLTPDGVVGPSTEAAMASIIDKIDALAADIKQIKSDTRHMPKRVWAHRIDTPGSIKKEFTSVNGAYSAGGLMAYNLIDFYLKGRNDKILEALEELDKDES